MNEDGLTLQVLLEGERDEGKEEVELSPVSRAKNKENTPLLHSYQITPTKCCIMNPPATSHKA